MKLKSKERFFESIVRNENPVMMQDLKSIRKKGIIKLLLDNGLFAVYYIHRWYGFIKESYKNGVDMKLSTTIRYGTRLMLDMAEQGDKGPVRIRTIAKRQGI